MNQPPQDIDADIFEHSLRIVILDLGCGAGAQDDASWDRVLNAAVLAVANPPDQEEVHGLVRLPCEIEVARPADAAPR